MKVTLILARRVKNELSMLDRAEADRDTPSKSLAVAAAKKGVRNALPLQVLPNSDAIKELSEREVKLCEAFFRDVGERHFVYTERQMREFKVAVEALRRCI